MMGFTWDADLMYTYGDAMGKEFFAKGAHVAMGPAVNVLRIPYNGRAFEYLSGEDPIVGAMLAPNIIYGI